MTNGDKIFKHLQYCKKHIHTPDLHSFRIDIRGGSAFVEVREGDEVFIETVTVSDDCQETFSQWAGTIMAAANRLEMLGADPITIEM